MSQEEILSPIQFTPMPIDQRPKPQVVQLNKFLIVVLTMVFAVVILSVLFFTSNRSTHSPGYHSVYDEADTSNIMPRQLQEASNAVPGHQHVLSLITPKNRESTLPTYPDLSYPSIPAKTNLKTDSKIYQAAADSPPDPPGIEQASANSLVNSHVNNEINSSPDNEFTSLDSSLPLNRSEVHTLKKLMGANHLDPNLQQQKESFLNALTQKLDKDYLNEPLKKPISPFEVLAGSKIPARTEQKLGSDLPGQFTALVRQNVYDTVSGRYLLIPQGSRIIMIYDSHVAYGQNRLSVVAKRIIFPNGESMDLEGMPGADSEGSSGFHDVVNNHYFKIYGTAILTGGISAAFQLSQPKQTNSVFQAPSTGQTIAAAMGQQLAQVTSETIGRNLDVQPTLTIRPGYDFNIIVNADMVFKGSYKDK